MSKRERVKSAKPSVNGRLPVVAGEPVPTAGVFDNAISIMALLAPSGQVLEANQAALKFHALSRSAVLGRRLWDVSWFRGAGPAVRQVKAAVTAAARGEIVRQELTLPGPQNQEHCFDFSLKAIDTGAGHGTMLLLEARDITLRKQAERALAESRQSLQRAHAALEHAHAELEKRVRKRTGELTEANLRLSEVISRRERVEQSLRESEAQTRAVLDTAVDAIITINERGIVATFNRAAERVFGYRANEVVGRNVSMLMPEPYGSEHDQYLDNYIRTGVPRIIGIGREVMGRRKNGTLFPVDLAVSEVRLGQQRSFTGVVRDLTDRKRLEKEILEIAEREQGRIGQDLHDGLSQQLAGIGFLAHTLQNTLERDRHPAAAEAGRITTLLGEAIRQGRGLARGLYPVEPKPEGLAFALKNLCQNVRDAYKIECTFTSRRSPVLEDRSTATHLYRIAQEAVNNAIRHGKAKRVEVALLSDRSGVTLRIRDSGVGLPASVTDSGAPPTGIGMRTMAHRAHLIGGTLTVTPGNPGVDVICRLLKRRSS